jgi:hypothetical protein
MWEVKIKWIYMRDEAYSVGISAFRIGYKIGFAEA